MPALPAFLPVRRVALKWPLSIGLLAVVEFLSACPGAAQGAAEYSHAVAGVGTGVASLSKNIDSALSQSKKPDSALSPDKKPALAVPTGVATWVAHQRALEQQAGKDAAKLTLKSAPARALVRIDGKLVGQTPLLLTLAPGSYKLEMEGPRMEIGKQQINLRPQETREVNLSLSRAPRYPTHIRLQ
jgi:hypothetical protein